MVSVSDISMEFSRWFPMTAWIWRHRFSLACALAALVLCVLIAYMAPEIAFLYRANEVLTTVISSPAQSLLDSEPLRRYCPELKSEDSTQYRVCSNGDLLHPVTFILVGPGHCGEGQDRQNCLVFYANLPRWKWSPLHLVVRRNNQWEGNYMRVIHRPAESSPRGVEVVLQRNAPDFRLNYSCALPFRSCETFWDYATVR